MREPTGFGSATNVAQVAPGETPKLVGLYKSGQLKIDEMITRTYTLDDINDGYQDMLDGKNIRGVVTFDESDW